MQNDIPPKKHWSRVEWLHETHQNPNIHLKGTHSYYSDAWSGGFEASVVRYLYGDAFSLEAWEPQWQIDQLYIGDYVCFGAEAVILMGGNHNHRPEWFSLYPFMESIVASYASKGNTHIEDGAWIGMRAMIMPGVRIGEGAVIAAQAVVTKDVPPYHIAGGNPATVLKPRFPQAVIDQLLALKIYDLSDAQFEQIRPHLMGSNIEALTAAISELETQP